MAQQVAWRRVFAEGAAIVVSILLAFSIQAWWEGLQERAEEDRLLRSVLQDSRANLDVIREASAYHQASLASERRILALAGAPNDQLTVEAADTLIGRLVWWYGSTHWSTGGLEALTAGGRLEVVRNQELRQTLASWSRRIDDVRYVEDQEGEFFNSALMPFLRREAYVPQIGETSQVLPGTDRTPKYGQVNWSTRVRDHRPLLVSAEFQNLVVQKLWVQVDILSAYGRFAEQLETLIREVEAELGETRIPAGS